MRTGAMGWLVWGMCYYALVSGDNSYNTMINAAGKWLLDRQRPDGLLMGGFNDDGSVTNWCSTEHQCSALQALQGLVLLIPNNGYSKSYASAANDVKSWLNPNSALHLFINGQNRYKQGYNDDKWALDCTTWATSTAYRLGFITKTKANECREKAKKLNISTNSFLVQGAGVVKNTNPNNKTNNNFNNGYELTGTVNGFKPYCDNSPDYYHYKEDTTNNWVPVPVPNDFVWSEGTLGYIHLCMLLNEDQEAEDFMDEIIKLQNCTGSTGGVIYFTKTYAGVGQNENEPWQGHVWEAVCSSAWLYLLINNPGVLFPPPPPPTNTITVNINGADNVYAKNNEKYTATLTPTPSNFGYIDWYLDDVYIGRDETNFGITIKPSGILTTYTEHLLAANVYTNTGDGINFGVKNIKIHATSHTIIPPI